MASIGYALSSEEHAPVDLVRHAQLAERAGFEFAGVSDHFHPWIDKQGHSPFVWSVIGGIAQATSSLALFTGVTCPLIRLHPVITAQAAPDAEAHAGLLRKYLDAGVDHVYVHQIGPRQEDFIRFLAEEVSPRLSLGTYASKQSA